jgi:AraC-like DNA-binding protein
MNLSFNWINLVILFGALQGLIFTIILLFQKKHPGAKFLAAFLFVLSYNGFETFNWMSGLDRYYMFFDMFGYVVIYGIGPSIYLYVRALLYPEQKISAKQIASHFSLLIFQFVSRVAIIVYHILWINKIVVSDISSMQLMAIVWTYAEPLSVAVFLCYLVASIKEFRNFSKDRQIKSIGKEGQQIVFKWIKSLLFCLVIMGIGWVLTVIAPYVLTIPFDSHYYPIELGMVVFIYWLVLNGYHKMKLIYLKPVSSISDTVSAIDHDKLYKQLQTAMEEERLYLDPELNLSKLASHTGISSKIISAILNQHHQTSFNDFINGYRVREVSKLMVSPGSQQYTISGIAFEAGFNSQATFQRAFKKQTGMSPREFMNNRLKESA